MFGYYLSYYSIIDSCEWGLCWKHNDVVCITFNARQIVGIDTKINGICEIVENSKYSLEFPMRNALVELW